MLVWGLLGAVVFGVGAARVCPCGLCGWFVVAFGCASRFGAGGFWLCSCAMSACVLLVFGPGGFCARFACGILESQWSCVGRLQSKLRDSTSLEQSCARSTSQWSCALIVIPRCSCSASIPAVQGGTSRALRILLQFSCAGYLLFLPRWHVFFSS